MCVYVYFVLYVANIIKEKDATNMKMEKYVRILEKSKISELERRRERKLPNYISIKEAILASVAGFWTLFLILGCLAKP